MLELIDKEEAIEILESFKNPGTPWLDKPTIRQSLYSDTINTGTRKEIANVVNTLMRKEIELKHLDRKLYEQDRKLLNSVQSILFKELAISLDTTYEKIDDWVVKAIKGVY